VGRAYVAGTRAGPAGADDPSHPDLRGIR